MRPDPGVQSDELGDGGRQTRLRRLTEVSRAFTYASSLKDILRLAADQAAEMLGAERAILMLTDEDGLLRVRASYGVAPEVVDRFRESFDESLVSRLLGLLGADSEEGFIGVPLVVQGNVTGLLAVVRDGGRPATQEDEWLLSALADQTAAPLESARLSEQVTRAALYAENGRLYQAERAAREEAETARAEAERASRAKSDFLATMSHELRTPLNAIAGHVQLLEMELHGPLTPAQHGALARITRAERHLLGLVNDVLNLARIESGTVEYVIAPVNIDDVLWDLTNLLEPQFKAKAIDFHFTVPGASAKEPLIVVADREKVMQILTNVAGNAAKFTPARGRVEVTATVEADAIVLRVTDTGPGIPYDKRDAIFEPFVQVHSDRTRTAEGTGLGLAISRDLARGMDGDLSLEQTSPAGSTFVLRLPRQVTTGASSPPVEA